MKYVCIYRNISYCGSLDFNKGATPLLLPPPLHLFFLSSSLVAFSSLATLAAIWPAPDVELVWARTLHQELKAPWSLLGPETILRAYCAV